MCDSGYDHSTRMEVIKAGTKKYFRQVSGDESGGKKLHRSMDEMASARKLKSLMNNLGLEVKEEE